MCFLATEKWWYSNRYILWEKYPFLLLLQLFPPQRTLCFEALVERYPDRWKQASIHLLVLPENSADRFCSSWLTLGDVDCSLILIPAGWVVFETGSYVDRALQPQSAWLFLLCLADSRETQGGLKKIQNRIVTGDCCHCSGQRSWWLVLRNVSWKQVTHKFQVILISDNLILSHCWQKFSWEAAKRQRINCHHKISGHGALAG